MRSDYQMWFIASMPGTMFRGLLDQSITGCNKIVNGNYAGRIESTDKVTFGVAPLKRGELVAG
jgi:hypothetical protein